MIPLNELPYELELLKINFYLLLITRFTYLKHFSPKILGAYMKHLIIDRLTFFLRMWLPCYLLTIKPPSFFIHNVYVFIYMQQVHVKCIRK